MKIDKWGNYIPAKYEGARCKHRRSRWGSDDDCPGVNRGDGVKAANRKSDHTTPANMYAAFGFLADGKTPEPTELSALHALSVGFDWEGTHRRMWPDFPADRTDVPGLRADAYWAVRHAERDTLVAE